MGNVSSERQTGRMGRMNWTHPVGLFAVLRLVLAVAIATVHGLVALRGHPGVRHLLSVGIVVAWSGCGGRIGDFLG